VTDFCVAGMDPGSHGAVAIIWPDLGKLLSVDLPTYKVTGTRSFTYCDGVAVDTSCSDALSLSFRTE
jgi:hypothetical protein